MPSDAITGRLAAVFERAPGLAAALRHAGQDTPRAIIAKARAALDGMTEGERSAVLDAHPRIGADAASLSLHSRREQGDAADAATLRELDGLNDAYEKKFGFRFVVFVNRRSKEALVPVLEARLRGSHDEERQTALREILAIAADRLKRGAV